MNLLMAEKRNCVRFRIHIRIGTHRIAADTGPAFRTPVVVGWLSAVMAFAAVNGTAVVAVFRNDFLSCMKAFGSGHFDTPLLRSFVTISSAV